MTTPLVVNVRPIPGSTAVSADGTVELSLRDADTKVDLGTLYLALTYSQAFYVPALEGLVQVIPSLNTQLKAESMSYQLDRFSDIGATVIPSSTAVTEAVLLMGPTLVYRQSNPDGLPHRGINFVGNDIELQRPVEASIMLDAQVFTTAVFPYLSFADSIGAVFGLIYGPKQTGVFLFFRDGPKRVEISGPSNDSIGTRPFQTTVAFDWSAAPTRYRLLWDETPGNVRLLVLAETTGVNTVLYDGAPPSNSFLPGSRLGPYSGEIEDKAYLVAGTDSSVLGDQLDIYGFGLHEFGKAVFLAGSPTGKTETEVRANALVQLVSGGVDRPTWQDIGEGTVSESQVLTREVGAAPAKLAFRRDEPALSQMENMVIFKMSASGITHPGTYNTGVGVSISDGTKQYLFRFLDDFLDHSLGLFTGGNIGLLEDYELSATEWEGNDRLFIFTQSLAAGGLVKLYIDDDEVPVLSTTFSQYPAAISASELSLEVGFVDADTSYAGEVTVSYVGFLCGMKFYDPRRANPFEFPQNQGWTRVTSGTPQVIQANRFRVDADTIGSYDIYYVADADYEEETGAAAFCKLLLTSWTNSAGDSSPPRSEIGPFLAVRMTATDAIGVRLTQTEAGKTVAYLAGTPGQALLGDVPSVEIDPTISNVFLLEVRPRAWVRLYLNYSSTPAIEVAWGARESVMTLAPTNLPVGGILAFGSLNEDAGFQGLVSFLRGATGTGYDVSARLLTTETEQSAHVYGAQVDIVADFEDKD